MTEAEWMAAGNPEPMLELLRRKASHRKLRLFAVACCLRIDHLITDSRSKAALEFLEAHADGGHEGQKGKPALCKAASAATKAAVLNTSHAASAAAEWAIRLKGAKAAECAATEARNAAAWEGVDAFSGESPSAYKGTYHFASIPDPFRIPERWAQAQLLRCIFGNPFRPAPTINPAWLAWNGGTVRALARSAYDDRELPSGHLDATRLALLADALEDAGCADAGVLEHLRSAGPHVRGCWVVDLLLGKE